MIGPAGIGAGRGTVTHDVTSPDGTRLVFDRSGDGPTSRVGEATCIAVPAS